MRGLMSLDLVRPLWECHGGPQEWWIRRLGMNYPTDINQPRAYHSLPSIISVPISLSLFEHFERQALVWYIMFHPPWAPTSCHHYVLEHFDDIPACAVEVIAGFAPRSRSVALRRSWRLRKMVLGRMLCWQIPTPTGCLLGESCMKYMKWWDFPASHVWFPEGI